MNDRKRFWVGLLVLLLAPWLVLAALAIYVWVVNAQPQTASLQTRVAPQVVMPWVEEAAYYVAFEGYRYNPAAPPPPPPQVDIAFMVDESGSMVSTIGEMAKAARAVAEGLSKEQPGRIRFAAIRFDTGAELESDWTDAPGKLYAGLDHIAQTAKSGANDSRAAFNELNKLLDRARSGAKKVVVFYTDGVIAACDAGCTPMSEDEIRQAAKTLREGQVEIYSVGLPGGLSHPLMQDVTGDSAHVKAPSSVGDIVNVLSEIKSSFAPSGPRASAGQLTHRLDGRHFATPLGGTSWAQDSRGALNLTLRPVPESAATFAHPLVPLSAGLWRVGLEPPKLNFVDQGGAAHVAAAVNRPLLLKITWLLLFLLFLPALLWLLWPLLRRRPRAKLIEERPQPLPEPQPTLPQPLPVLPRVRGRRWPPVPTLFIGLGGTGRHALHAMRADLRQSHLGALGEPYRFCWLDTDSEEEKRPTPFEDWEGYPIEACLAPPQVRQSDQYLPTPGPLASHLRWFNASRYYNAPSAALNLSEGARGDRSLARLALFQWLPQGLLATLLEQIKQLAALPASDGTRQIIVVAASDGGVGSGWFLDLGRLLQRLARQQGFEILPEVIGVLCDDSQPRHPENRQALALEVESTALAGKAPQHVIYQPGAALLDQIDQQSPYQTIFAVSAADPTARAAQGGDLAAVLVERQPRARLLAQAREISPHQPLLAASYGVHVLPTLIYDQVRCELFLRLLGPDVLLDVTADPQGGLRPKPVTEATALHQLEEWSRSETPGSPLALLLTAAVHPSATLEFTKLMQGAEAIPRAWLARTFAAALTQRLQGQQPAAGGSWQRDCMPGEATAALRLLAQRLSQLVQPELSKNGAGPVALDAATHLATLAQQAAAALDRWVEDFCRLCERLAAERRALAQARRQLLRLQGRAYLDAETTPAEIESWARAGLETWLRTPDTISAIRQALFFAARAQGEQLNLCVHLEHEASQDFANAATAAAALDRLARTLALGVPAVRVGGVLAATNANRRRTAAHELVRPDTLPQQVLLVAPQTSDAEQGEQQAVEEFKRLIPRPSGQAPRAEQDGDDPAAIRRFELSLALTNVTPAPDVTLPFIEPAERAAELLRQRAEQYYRIAVPLFPPHLRLALSQPERFASFARAYKAGQLDVRFDERGRAQWFLQTTGEQLTYGAASSLASAAAGYLWYVQPTPDTVAPASPGGSFAKLEQWRAQRGALAPDEDTLAQIALSLVE